MTFYRHAAISLVLLTSVSAADAQTTVITREPAQTQTVVTTRPLQLTPTQRQTVYQTIVREKVEPAQATVAYRVGMRVPETVRLYSVPQPVIAEVPVISQYKYMVVNNRVVLVDPVTSQVVDEVVD